MASNRVKVTRCSKITDFCRVTKYSNARVVFTSNSGVSVVRFGIVICCVVTSHRRMPILIIGQT